MPDKTYCYLGTDVLKNEFNITDSEKLKEAEMRLATIRLAELQLSPEQGCFDFAHLKRIHKRIFQDLYVWAGCQRTVNIAKNNSLFCPAWNIQSYAQDIFRSFYKDCMETAKDPGRFICALAGHYADLNALHPFREGNGRSQREFTRMLCLKCGYAFDMTQTCHKEMVSASRLSLEKGDNTELERILKKAIIPMSG